MNPRDLLPSGERAGGSDTAGAFDVVVVAGSAGALPVTLAVLRGLGPAFALPVVLMYHLPASSDAADYFRSVLRPRHVEWVGADSVLEASSVLVCPPRSFVELLPDGTFRLAPCERGALDAPIDRLLESVARSFGERAIGVVLTGMGSDGARGACELHAAGSRVIVQSPASAEHADMPQAAIQAGAAGLIVPGPDIGQVIRDLVAGTPRPRARSEATAILRTFGAIGEVARVAHELDWAVSPLGPVLDWPPELATMVRTVLDSPRPAAVWWGAQHLQVFNDRWCEFLGMQSHPRALGAPGRETWTEIWPAIGPTIEQVLARGEAVAGEDDLLMIDRHGYLEEVYASFSYSPIRDASQKVVGVFHTGSETTSKVLSERRMRALRAVATATTGAGTVTEVCEGAALALGNHAGDVPFALFYVLDADGRQVALAGVTGLDAGSASAPHVLPLSEEQVWPLGSIANVAPGASGEPFVLDDLAARFPGLSLRGAARHGARAPHSAVVMPLRAVANQRPVGAMVLALSPHRPFDEDYRDFVDLVAQQVNASMVEARARQLERERGDRLDDLDRAKTEFFSNISHEFRTPLTMLLAPLDHFLRERDDLPERFAAEVEVAARNARRLLRLVDSLLDFSQIEARQQRVHLEPANLGLLTADIASAFRSAVENAGLRLQLDIADGVPEVPVNVEMWEKVVSNLLSNAFKFTFEGEIVVRLRALRMHAELEVADSGIGIPKAELPHVFKRFHRVHGARARTAEGSGIGLAIAQDLVQRMGGQISVRSAEGRGTTFTIWLPYKSSRLVEAAQGRRKNDAPAVSSDLAVEAAGWRAGREERPDLPEGAVESERVTESGRMTVTPCASEPRILVADDNADIREYLRRLLGERWTVETVADGAAALAAARRAPPQAIVADVMMPGMDGLDLLARVRAEPALKHTPVILVSARAGDEAVIRGLAAGADDYVAKPFSPRELVARVQAAVDRANARAISGAG